MIEFAILLPSVKAAQPGFGSAFRNRTRNWGASQLRWQAPHRREENLACVPRHVTGWSLASAGIPVQRSDGMLCRCRWALTELPRWTVCKRSDHPIVASSRFAINHGAVLPLEDIK